MKGTKKDLTERLMEISLFAGMSCEQVADAVRRIGGELRQFQKGEAVVYEGTKAKWVVPVLSGRLTVYVVTGGKLVKNKFTVAGVLIDGVGYAVGTSKKLLAIPFALSK